ncbi:DUF3618 domain-containing protein [Deinococcus deserti]|uniref:Uncharacterized protein n=1 Tax=Deinococcus deserti (strain DSM 17065 / CIP 109153 / LMG 22923 / VCD115) TaxID=546414 RepID=C1D3Z2_DEIDV|nr:hypothetical protein Deide_3p02551 [Deinococcus deserti VCD115]
MNTQQALTPPTTLEQEWTELLSYAKEQGRQLEAIRKRAGHLPSNQTSVHVPWSLFLLAGGAYALYRRNPSVQQRVQGIADRIPPGARNNLTQTARAAKDAIRKVNPKTRGTYPGTGTEWRRDGELPLDHATSSSDPLKDKVIDRLQQNPESSGSS